MEVYPAQRAAALPLYPLHAKYPDGSNRPTVGFQSVTAAPQRFQILHKPMPERTERMQPPKRAGDRTLPYNHTAVTGVPSSPAQRLQRTRTGASNHSSAEAQPL